MCCVYNCRVWTPYWQEGRLGKKPLCSNVEILCLNFHQSPELSPLPELPFAPGIVPPKFFLPAWRAVSVGKIQECL